MANGVRISGKTKFFNGERGFGFIVPDDGGQDVFIHIKELRRAGLDTLRENQVVLFDTEPGRNGKGPKAVNVQLGK